MSTLRKDQLARVAVLACWRRRRLFHSTTAILLYWKEREQMRVLYEYTAQI